VPFKVPFNTVPVDRQAIQDEGTPACDEAEPLPDPDGAVQKTSIDLTDLDDEVLSCGSDFLTQS